MRKDIKWLMIGIVIGMAVGITVFYALTEFGLFHFWFGNFRGSGNFTRFPRNFSVAR